MKPFIALVGAYGLGKASGLRAMTPAATLAWGHKFGWTPADGPFGRRIPWDSAGLRTGLTALAAAELVADKLPGTPSRKVPGSFALRLVSGAFAGATLCDSNDAPAWAGALAGAAGAVVGTLAGYEFRVGADEALELPDLPVALFEDFLAVGGSFLVLWWWRNRRN